MPFILESSAAVYLCRTRAPALDPFGSGCSRTTDPGHEHDRGGQAPALRARTKKRGGQAPALR